MKPSLFNRDHNNFELPPHLASEIVGGRIAEVSAAVQSVGGYTPQPAKAEAVGFTSLKNVSIPAQRAPMGAENPLFTQQAVLPVEQPEAAVTQQMPSESAPPTDIPVTAMSPDQLREYIAEQSKPAKEIQDGQIPT
ncbi:MAG TPA: hypothetical protein VHD60_00300 [Candidatus Saccharimonadales bacterium]|nr:hypothetical protein [Candidatus Saccharimonadales bacterium]